MAKSSSKSGLAALTAVAGKKETAKSKSSVPTVDAPESLRPAIAEWIEAKRAEKTAESNRKAAEAAMVDTARELRIQRCRKDGELYSSIRLNGGASGTISMVQSSAFKKMTAEEHQDALLAIFGDKDFERFFTVKTSFTIDAEKLAELPNGDKIASKIAEALGPAASDILKVDTVIVPTEQYVNAMVFDDKVAEKAEEAIANGHAVPFSPSFRL